MCGRMNITDDPLALWISENLGIQLQPKSNSDFRPTQSTPLLLAGLAIKEASWGIHPAWSDRIIINARSETVLQKALFANRFEKRVLVPCSGWYEWCTAPSGKEKRAFLPAHDSQFLMAGLEVEPNQFVTLTRKPTSEYEKFHHRMPLLIHAEQARDWLDDSNAAKEMLSTPWDYAFQSEASEVAPQQNYSLF